MKLSKQKRKWLLIIIFIILAFYGLVEMEVVNFENLMGPETFFGIKKSWSF